MYCGEHNSSIVQSDIYKKKNNYGLCLENVTKLVKNILYHFGIPVLLSSILQ